MRTTELFVEQLVIGVATLVTGLLLFDPRMIDGLREVEFGTVVLATTSAYLLGIVTDRVADTLLERAERIHRLLFGLRGWYRWARRKADRDRRASDESVASAGRVRDDGPAPDDAPPTDPFPEDVLRARLWGADASLAEYATYHRSRIRLTRSIAVLAPAAGAAMIAQLLTARQPLEATIVRASVLTAYGLAFVLALWPRRAFGAVGAVPLLFGTELPRTGTLAETDGREAFEALLGGTIKEANEVSGAAPRPLRRPLLLTLLRHDASVQLAALLLAIAAWRGTTTGAVELGRPIALLALGTALVTLLFGWTWWRVTRTFYDLLEDLPATSAAPPRKD